MKSPSEKKAQRFLCGVERVNGPLGRFGAKFGPGVEGRGIGFGGRGSDRTEHEVMDNLQQVRVGSGERGVGEDAVRNGAWDLKSGTHKRDKGSALTLRTPAI